MRAKLILMFVFYFISQVIPSLSAVLEERRQTGFLTSDCLQTYIRIFMNRIVPPRTYMYFHETMIGKSTMNSDNNLYDDELNYRIVGGNSISVRYAPYQVMYGPYCGGALIAPEWVITSAHCKEKQHFILTGATKRSQMSRYEICSHFTHPDWFNPNKQHSHDFDFQLLLLEKPVPVTAYSRPVAIGSDSDVRPGKMFAVTGWGFTYYKEGKMTEVLRRVYLPVVSNRECRKVPVKEFNITSRMFCGGYLNATRKDSCQGDSGGPAVLDGHLVGVVSFGIGCASPGKPGVYALVPKVRHWIRQVTALPL